jgi:hypothetical protein
MSPIEPVPTQPSRPAVDAGRLWAGGVATAVVAALVALVGVLVWEGVFDIDMVRPPLLEIGDSFGVQYAATAAALALLATGLAHLLMLSTPRPRAFFGWIVGLTTVAGAAIPLTLDGSTQGKLATSSVNIVIGLCILTLVSSIMGRSIRSVRRTV